MSAVENYKRSQECSLTQVTDQFLWSFVTPTLCKDLFYSCFVFFVNEPSLSDLDGFVYCVIVCFIQILY